MNLSRVALHCVILKKRKSHLGVLTRTTVLQDVATETETCLKAAITDVNYFCGKINKCQAPRDQLRNAVVIRE